MMMGRAGVGREGGGGVKSNGGAVGTQKVCCVDMSKEDERLARVRPVKVDVQVS